MSDIALSVAQWKIRHRYSGQFYFIQLFITLFKKLLTRLMNVPFTVLSQVTLAVLHGHQWRILRE